MIIELLTFYLVFIIVVSALLGLLFVRTRLTVSKAALFLIICVLLAPLPFGYFYIAYFDSLPEVVVPPLTGMTIEAAQAKLSEAGLRGRLAGEVYNLQYPAGVVVVQRPEAGRKVKTGRVVNLLTSSGRRKVEAPNLLGRTVSQAEGVLAAKGLVLGEIRYEYAPDIDSGLILSQTPLPGEEMETDTPVFITVSASAEAPEAPNTTQPEEEEDKGGFKLW